MKNIGIIEPKFSRYLSVMVLWHETMTHSWRVISCLFESLYTKVEGPKRFFFGFILFLFLTSVAH